VENFLGQKSGMKKYRKFFTRKPRLIILGVKIGYFFRREARFTILYVNPGLSV